MTDWSARHTQQRYIGLGIEPVRSRVVRRE
jgi:hypothetical protein